MTVRTVIHGFQAVSHSGDIVRIPLHAVLEKCAPARLADSDQVTVMQFRYQELLCYCHQNELDESTKVLSESEAKDTDKSPQPE
jgi:hypothetical protein